MLVLTIIILVLVLIIFIFVIGVKYNPKIIYSTEFQRYCILYEKTSYEEVNGETGDYRFELRRIMLSRIFNIFHNE